MLNFKLWLESVDLFPRPQDLLAFLDHAMTATIKTSHKLYHTGKKELQIAVENLTQCLRQIHDSVESRLDLPHPLDTDHDKFRGKGEASLQINQYQHRFRGFPDVFEALKRVGSHYFVEPHQSRELTKHILEVQKLALHSEKTVVKSPG